MSEMRHWVDALRRNLALELAIVRLYRLAAYFVLKCTVALVSREPFPDPSAPARDPDNRLVEPRVIW